MRGAGRARLAARCGAGRGAGGRAAQSAARVRHRPGQPPPGAHLLGQGAHGGHHDGDVDAGGEGVDGDGGLLALGAHLLAHLPHVGGVDLAHGPPVEALHRVDHRLDLVAASHVLVDLVADVHGGVDGGRVGLLEDRLARGVKLVVHAQHALAGDDARDGAGDRLHRLLERLLVAARGGDGGGRGRRGAGEGRGGGGRGPGECGPGGRLRRRRRRRSAAGGAAAPADLMPPRVYRRKSDSTAPCTPPRMQHRSP